MTRCMKNSSLPSARTYLIRHFSILAIVAMALILALGGAARLVAEANEVEQFFLFDANSDLELFELKDGDTINLDIVGNSLNIRAECNQCLPGVSVVFTLTGATERQHTERAEPYFLAGDKDGDVFAMAFNAGFHQLEAHVVGVPGQGTTIGFEVVAMTGDRLVRLVTPPLYVENAWWSLCSAVNLHARPVVVHLRFFDDVGGDACGGTASLELQPGEAAAALCNSDIAGQSQPIRYCEFVYHGRANMVLGTAQFPLHLVDPPVYSGGVAAVEVPLP